MFGKNMFLKPWDITKTQEYYQSILELTSSVDFKHFLYSNQNDPSYSTTKILKILSPS